MQKWPKSLTGLFLWKLYSAGGGYIDICIFLHEWKSTVSSNRNSLILGKNSQAHRCCSCSGLCGFFGFVSMWKLVFKKRKNLTTVYRLKNYCFLYY